MSSGRCRLFATIWPVKSGGRLITATATAGDRGDEAERRAPTGERARAGTEQHRERQDDEGDGPRGRAQREPEVHVGEPREDRSVGRRMVEGVRADRDQRADREEHDEEAPLLPAQRAGGEQPADREEVSRPDQPEVLGVRDARLDPGAELVVAVEEPVTEARAAARARSRPSRPSRRSRCSGGSGCRTCPAPTAPRSTRTTRRA